MVKSTKPKIYILQNIVTIAHRRNFTKETGFLICKTKEKELYLGNLKKCVLPK